MNRTSTTGALRNEPLVRIAIALTALEAWILFSPAIKVIVWPDAIAYLTPGADAIERGYFSHEGSRGFVYPAVLWAVLRFTPDPTMIVALQRLLAWLGYILLVCTTVIVTRLTFPSPHWPSRAFAAFWLIVYAFYTPTHGLTHAIAPETLATFLLVGALCSVVLLPFATGSRAATIGLTVVAVVASFTLALVRPHWQFAALALPIILVLVSDRRRRREVALAVTVAVIASAVLLVWPELRLQKQYDAYLSRVVGPRHLFCSSGDVIFEYLSGRKGDAFSDQVRESLGRMLTPESRAAARDWTMLGFNADYCIHQETSVLIASHFANDASAETSYYLRTYAAAIVRAPGYLPWRVLKGLGSVARRPFAAVATDYWVRASDDPLRAAANARPLYGLWVTQYKQAFSGIVDLPSRRWLLGSRVFYATTGFLLGGIVTFAVGSVVLGRGDRRARAALVPVLISTLLTNLLIALVHTFEPRYVVMQAPMFVLLGLVATPLAFDAMLDVWKRHATRTPAAVNC